jgi:hypothetical protein
MKRSPLLIGRNCLVRGVALLFSLMLLGRAYAAPTIVSTDPASGVSSVPLTAAVTITFSEAMNTAATVAYFFDLSVPEQLQTTASWSAGNTVLTCMPTASWPAGRTVSWTVNGQNPAGTPLGGGFTGGDFKTVFVTQLALTNAIWSGGVFAFDVTSQAGQTLTVEYSSTLRSNQWQTLLTTNSPAGRVHVIDPHSSTNRYLFYRARTGS